MADFGPGIYQMRDDLAMHPIVDCGSAIEAARRYIRYFDV